MGLTDKLKKATASIQWGAKTMSGRHLDQATVRGEIKDVLGYGEGPREWVGPRYQYKSLGPGQIRLGEPKVYDNRLWK